MRSGFQIDFAVEILSAVAAKGEDRSYWFAVGSEVLIEVWQVVAALSSLAD